MNVEWLGMTVGWGHARDDQAARWLALGLIEFGIYPWGFRVYIGPARGFIAIEVSLFRGR